MGASLLVSALALGNITPKSENARVVPGVSEGQEIGICGGPDFLSQRPESQGRIDLPSDELAALQGRFERAGFHLYELHDGSLLATSYGATRRLQGIGCARAFLSMIGGAQ